MKIWFQGFLNLLFSSSENSFKSEPDGLEGMHQFFFQNDNNYEKIYIENSRYRI